MMDEKFTTREIKHISDSRGVRLMRESDINKLRDECLQIMWKHYSENKSKYSRNISDFRDDIILGLMEGKEVEDVFDSVTPSTGHKKSKGRSRSRKAGINSGGHIATRE